MRPARPLDREDPFGSLLDEKPPEGWDERFIDQVRRRIESRGQDPESEKLPEPPGRRRKTSFAALALIGISAVLYAWYPADGPESPAHEIPYPTVVSVDGSRPADVAVEWASRAGRASDVVVVQSFSPEIAYLREVSPGESAVPVPSSAQCWHFSGSAPGHVLVQLFRGDRHALDREVSTTTIFQEPSSLMRVADPPPGAEEELRAQMQALYELKEVSSLGTRLVSLSGGTAVVDSDGDQVRIQMVGQPLGDRTVRLLIRQQHDGMEDSATSVVARYGRTFMLSGPAPAGEGSDSRPLFLFLTPLPSVGLGLGDASGSTPTGDRLRHSRPRATPPRPCPGNDRPRAAA